MKSEAEIRELRVELHASRLTIGQTSTAIVAKGAGVHTLKEQRLLHGGCSQADQRAIYLQIALLTYLLQ